MLRRSARQRASLFVLLSILAAALVAATAAISVAAPTDDQIIIDVEGHSATVTYGEDAQVLTNSGSRCRVTNGIDGPILDFDASSFTWWGGETDAYVGIDDSTLGVNTKGWGFSHYCKKIDYLGHDRSEMLLISLDDAPTADDKIIESADLRLRSWFSSTALITYYRDGSEVGTTTHALSHGVNPISASPGEGVLFDAFEVSSKHGSFGIHGTNVLHLESLKVTPTISTEVLTPEVTVGDQIVDSATVSSDKSPTGTVTFRIYLGSCDGPLVGTVTGELDEYGYTESDPYTTQSAGDHYWVATYEGDDQNHAVTDECPDDDEISSVAKAEASVETVATESVTVGETISNTATITGFEPGGTVMFDIYFGSCDNLVASLTEGVSPAGDNPNIGEATASYDTEEAGIYVWVVTYSGDGNNIAPDAQPCSFDPGDEPDESEADPASPAITVSPDETDEVIGELVSASALLEDGFGPVGTLTFALYTSNVCDIGSRVALLDGDDLVDVDGNGTYDSVDVDSLDLGVGTFYWGVEYSGDDNNDSASDCGSAVQIYQQGVACLDGDSEGGSEGDIADEASFQRGFKETGEDSCEVGPIPVTLEISDEEVTFDFPTNSLYEGARFIVRIAWNPDDPVVDPLDPPDREVDYTINGGYVLGLPCTGTDAPAGATPDVIHNYDHPVGAPVCLAGQEILLSGGQWQQIQYWDVLFDPKWR